MIVLVTVIATFKVEAILELESSFENSLYPDAVTLNYRSTHFNVFS